jgi:simple sugar transport system permease protein
MITLGVFVLGYLYCLTQFPGFASTRVICNILTDNAFLGIIAVGMTFVILSGGIDLSVGSVIAFTGVFLAKAIGFWGISPLVAFPLVLAMGCAFGAFMGLLIDALKIPAFIITLAGMFFLRGVSYLVSEESIPINHPVYDTLSSLAWKIPGGGRLSAMGLLMLGVVVVTEAALSFLGVGVPPPKPAWGLMLADGKKGMMAGYWWLTVLPGCCIMFMVLSANLLGDWLRVKLDPQLRQL